MPSLIRLIVLVGLLVGLAYGAMYGLVLYVEPSTREISERVPTDKINPIRQPTIQAAPENEEQSN